MVGERSAGRNSSTATSWLAAPGPSRSAASRRRAGPAVKWSRPRPWELGRRDRPGPRGMGPLDSAKGRPAAGWTLEAGGSGEGSARLPATSSPPRLMRAGGCCVRPATAVRGRGHARKGGRRSARPPLTAQLASSATSSPASSSSTSSAAASSSGAWSCSARRSRQRCARPPATRVRRPPWPAARPRTRCAGTRRPRGSRGGQPPSGRPR